MSTGRLFFAGSILLGLAWFALRSPLPVADPRFIKEDFDAGGAPASISVYLETGASRDAAHGLIKACFDALAAGGREAAPAGVEACARSLKAGGINNLMVNCAGTLAVRGKRGQAPWRIGIRTTRPKGPNDVLGYVLEDRDEALATRGEDDPGPRVAGAPWRSVTVLAADAPAAAKAAASLYATAPPAWPALLETLGATQVVAVAADGQISVTKTLGERMKFLHEPALKPLP